MKHPYFKSLLKFIGFRPINNFELIYSKTYSSSQYTITVDFEKDKINYPLPLTLGDKTTSNFEASENFVVLECVDRLLEKGYKPENITLEKKWGLGHREKGKADIFISYPKSDEEKSEKAFLIIECKTWGKEFEHEFEKTQSNGGQLLSYYVQEPETRLLCLYASTFKDEKRRYASRIIESQDSFKGKNKADIYKLWKDGNEQIVGQSFKYDGIFDDEATPYNVILKPLKRKNLVELQQGDSGYIYNQFAEILRHNVVSDKPNAFNKMFNLILAKIVDEDRPDEEELSFQWRDGDTDIELQKRLNDLYKKGMFEYLHKTVTDFSDDELDDELRNLSPTVQESLRRRITALRLHKNNEFAFKEVFDETSFRDNAKVVREAVILLQNFQLRYSHKQQFLSNFFELLLSNTLKQEAGQFFTPVPVAKFILSSLPLQEIIEQKIKERKADFLPTVIDYAAGSGHFLTEAMDEIQQIIQQLDTKNCTQSIKSNLETWKTESQAYKWADRFIYGIEKDYRLSKIAKVSCFLNGDGIANIIHADGLDTFDSEAYQNAPLLHLKKNAKDNPNFDILVANPPYSVSAFIKTLAKGKESFDMYDAFTEQGKEIECLFIERTKQITKENGLVGIVLPSSILNNSGVYTLAREVILKYFKIVSIVEFGSSTFMATGTNTITLFLKRRKDTDFKNIQDAIQQFFKDGNDTVCNSIENAFSNYIQHVYKLQLVDYVSFIQQKSNEQIIQTELYQDYQKYYNNLSEIKNLKDRISKLKHELSTLKLKTIEEKIVKKITETEAIIAKAEKDLIQLFYEKIFAIEQEKMLYFMLAYPQEIVLIKTNPTGNNDQEKEFLGYEFSNRRGHEGIKMFSDAQGNFTTKLYHETDRKDITKANSYVYNAFLGDTQMPVHESLKENIQTQKLYEMMKFDRVGFEKDVTISFKKKTLIDIESKWELVKLDKVITLVRGVTYAKTDQVLKPTSKIILTADNITLAGSLIISKEVFLKEDIELNSEKELRKNDIFICLSSGSKNHLGKMAYVNEDTNYFAGGFMGILRTKSEFIYSRFAYELLNTENMRNLVRSEGSGSNINNLSSSIGNIKIPLPPKHIQEKIVKEILEIEAKENENREIFVELENEIEKCISTFDTNVPANKICSIGKVKIEPQDFKDQAFNYIGLEHIQSNTGKLINHELTKGIVLKSTKNAFDKGDLLFGKLRPYLNKVYIAESEGICSTDILVLKTDNPLLLKQILLSKFFVEQSSSLMKGINLPRLQVQDFLNFKVPFPSNRIKATEEIVSIETQKQEIEQFLNTVQEQKEEVLKKYL